MKLMRRIRFQYTFYLSTSNINQIFEINYEVTFETYSVEVEKRL